MSWRRRLLDLPRVAVPVAALEANPAIDPVLTEAGGTTERGLGYLVSASRAEDDGYRVHSAFDASNLYTKLELFRSPRAHVTAIVAGTSYYQ